MACCLAAPSHYLNPYWLIISKVQMAFIWEKIAKDSYQLLKFHTTRHSHQSQKFTYLKCQEHLAGGQCVKVVRQQDPNLLHYVDGLMPKWSIYWGIFSRYFHSLLFFVIFFPFPSSVLPHRHIINGKWIHLQVQVQVQNSLYCFPYIDVQQTSMVKYNKYMLTKECICLNNSDTDQTP